MALLKALVLVAGQIVQLGASDTVADWTTIANKPTTLSGFGIAASDVLSTLLGVDGAGSGLDADLLDGQSSAFYQSASNLNAGTLAAARIADNSLPPAKVAFAATARFLGRTTAGAGAGEELTGANAATIIGYTAADVLAKMLTVDGAGSGLDADLLDGNSSAFYLDIGNATGTLDNNRIAANSLPLNRLANATATSRVLGRITAGSGAWEELTGANLLTISGGLAASSYTAADVLAKMLTVDGAGSGLDADLLDGLSSAAFAKLSGNQTFTAGDLSTSRSGTPAQGILFLGDQSGGSRWLFYNGTNYALQAAELTINAGTAWHSGNDGAGSGLDADLLDGQSGAFYNDAGNLTGVVAAAQLGVNSIPVNRIVQIPDQRILGNTAGATGNVAALTAAQVAAIIDAAFVSLTVTGAATVTSNISTGGVIIGTAANMDIRKDTVAAADTEAVRIGAGGAIGSTRGGTIQLFGINHATNPGNILLQAGTGSFKPSGANIAGILFGTKTFDLPSVTQGVANAGAQTTVTVTGAAVGDVAMATITSLTTTKWIVSAIVSAANTVTVTFHNMTAAAVDPASGTLNCFVLQAP